MGKLLKEQLNVLQYSRFIKAPDYKNYKSVSLPFTALTMDTYVVAYIVLEQLLAATSMLIVPRWAGIIRGGGSNTASPLCILYLKGDIVTAIGYHQFRAYFIYTK